MAAHPYGEGLMRLGDATKMILEAARKAQAEYGLTREAVAQCLHAAACEEGYLPSLRAKSREVLAPPSAPALEPGDDA